MPVLNYFKATPLIASLGRMRRSMRMTISVQGIIPHPSAQWRLTEPAIERDLVSLQTLQRLPEADAYVGKTRTHSHGVLPLTMRATALSNRPVTGSMPREAF